MKSIKFKTLMSIRKSNCKETVDLNSQFYRNTCTYGNFLQLFRNRGLKTMLFVSFLIEQYIVFFKACTKKTFSRDSKFMFLCESLFGHVKPKIVRNQSWMLAGIADSSVYGKLLHLFRGQSSAQPLQSVKLVHSMKHVNQ